MKIIRSVMFDVGNTLLHMDYEAVARIITSRALAVEADQVRTADNMARSAVKARSANRDEYWMWKMGPICEILGVPDHLVPSIAQRLGRENHATSRSLWRVPDPEAHHVLELLGASGYRLAAVSNSDGRIKSHLAAFDLVQYMEFVVDSGVAGIEKPDPGIFEVATDKMGVAPCECVYVGDIYAVDVVGARAAGLNPVLYNQFPPEEANCPVIYRLGELPGVLELMQA